MAADDGRSWFSPSSWLGSLRRDVAPILAIGGAALLVLLFGLVADVVTDGASKGIDAAVLTLLRGPDHLTPLGPPWFEEAIRDLTALGSFTFIGLVFLTATSYLLILGRRRHALLLTGAIVGGALLSTFLKMGFDRPRPGLPDTVTTFTSSFPSGHAMLAASTFLTLGALLTRANRDRQIKIFVMGLAVALTLMVGLSRLYLGVHFATDVIAGWLAGSAWALLCWSLAFHLQRRGSVEAARG